MLLSVIVISHNQKSQIARCLESILSQELPFEYEIVISDDSSTDGTWELERNYAARYPFISVFQCNSDDCHPAITSERSGYNRSNAYNHSSGKYFVHIDGDDWYRPGTDCLARMVELLEDHPECSICMQDEWCWNEGEPLDCGKANHPLHRFKTGEILSAEEYYRMNILANNGTMMMRRNDSQNPAVLYHKWYVDTIITAHHLQFGSIVCLDRNDWIYTQSPSTITNSIKSNERIVLWGLDWTILTSILVPRLSPLYFSSSIALAFLLDAVRMILSSAVLSDEICGFCRQFKYAFLFRMAMSQDKTVLDRFRLLLIGEMIKWMMKKNSSCIIFVLRHLCI